MKGNDCRNKQTNHQIFRRTMRVGIRGAEGEIVCVPVQYLQEHSTTLI